MVQTDVNCKCDGYHPPRCLKRLTSWCTCGELYIELLQASSNDAICLKRSCNEVGWEHKSALMFERAESLSEINVSSDHFLRIHRIFSE